MKKAKKKKKANKKKARTSKKKTRTSKKKTRTKKAKKQPEAERVVHEPGNFNGFLLDTPSWDRLSAEIQNLSGLRINPEFNEKMSNYELCLFSVQFFDVHNGLTKRELLEFKRELSEFKITPVDSDVKGLGGAEIKAPGYDEGDLPDDIEKDLDELIKQMRADPKRKMPSALAAFLREQANNKSADIGFIDFQNVIGEKPPAKGSPVIDLKNNTATYQGKTHALTKRQAEVLNKLIDARGGLLSSYDLKKKPGSYENISKIIKRLPSQLHGLIESVPYRGYIYKDPLE